MIISIVLGDTGCQVALCEQGHFKGLKMLKMGNVEDQIKASLASTAGIVFLLAGSSIFSENSSSRDQSEIHSFIHSLMWRSGACGIAGVSRMKASAWWEDWLWPGWWELSLPGLITPEPSQLFFSFCCMTFFFFDSLDSLQGDVWTPPSCWKNRWSHVGRRGCNDVLGVPSNGTGTKATVSLQGL